MTHQIQFEVPVDTSHFTARQLQQRTLLSLSWNGYARWLKEHVVSLPRLIKEYHLGTVIIGAHIDYIAPFTFFDDDSLKVNVEVRPWAGQILELNVSFCGAGQNVVQVYILLYPVAIQEHQTLAAVPTRIPKELLPKFHPDEDDLSRSVPNLEIPELVQQVEQTGRLLMKEGGTFTIHNHLIEVAEQWAFIETPGIVQAIREPLILTRLEKTPALSRALSQPMQSFRAEFHHPYYVFDQGQVETKAYLWQDKLAFIHRLFSEYYGQELHGTIVEQF